MGLGGKPSTLICTGPLLTALRGERVFQHESFQRTPWRDPELHRKLWSGSLTLRQEMLTQSNSTNNTLEWHERRWWKQQHRSLVYLPQCHQQTPKSRPRHVKFYKNLFYIPQLCSHPATPKYRKVHFWVGLFEVGILQRTQYPRVGTTPKFNSDARTVIRKLCKETFLRK